MPNSGPSDGAMQSDMRMKSAFNAKTRVVSRLAVKPNPRAEGKPGPLRLDGELLELVSVKLGGQALDASAYRPALLTMVGVLAVGLVANLLIRPVAQRFHENGDVQVLPSRTDAIGGDDGTVAHGGASRVFLSWAVVLLLLGYGVVMTLLTALRLFT